MFNPGDIVYIEATLKQGPWSIKGQYEIHHTDEDNIYLKEIGLTIKVERSKIAKIEKIS